MNDTHGFLEGLNNHNQSGGTEYDFHLPWYIQLLYMCLFTAMVLVSICGNSVVIWIVLGHKRMRTVANYFLVNLAASDISISVFNTVFTSVYMVFGNNWVFGQAYCKFSQFITHCSIGTSVFTFVAIAVDRYVAIIHPLKPRLPHNLVLSVIAATWLASAIVALPNLLYGVTVQFGDDDRTICLLRWPDGKYFESPFDLVYQVFLLMIEYFLPLVVLVATYARVGVELWGNTVIGDSESVRHQENIRSKRKVVKMMAILVTIFSICWLPQHLYFIITTATPELAVNSYSQHIYLCIYWVAMSFAMYNPFIYCWMNARFRKGFKYVFRWCPFVEWNVADTLSQSFQEELNRKRLCYTSSTSTRTLSCRKNSVPKSTADTAVYCENEAISMSLLSTPKQNSDNGFLPNVQHELAKTNDK